MLIFKTGHDAMQYDKSTASCQAPECLYNAQYLLFCLAMFTTSAETTELELTVLPFAMSDEDPSSDEDKDDDEVEPGEEDLEDLDEDEEDGEEDAAE